MTHFCDFKGPSFYVLFMPFLDTPSLFESTLITHGLFLWPGLKSIFPLFIKISRNNSFFHHKFLVCKIAAREELFKFGPILPLKWALSTKDGYYLRYVICIACAEVLLQADCWQFNFYLLISNRKMLPYLLRHVIV